MNSGTQPGLLRVCPICETTTDDFLPFTGDPSKNPRPNAKCPECGALERHRMIWLYLLNETNLFHGSTRVRLLHVAPEPIFYHRLVREPLVDYVCGDLNPTYAKDRIEVIDVTDLNYPDESFDAVICSHVLEHVPDDRRAMREFARVMKPTGWGIIMVPVIREVTDEDLTVTDLAERTRRFGQFDHVRAYGPDYAERLRDAGFDVTVDAYARRIGPTRARRYGLGETEDVYFVRRC